MTYFPLKVSKKEKGPQKWSPTADQLQRGSLARGKNPQTDAVIHKETKNPWGVTQRKQEMCRDKAMWEGNEGNGWVCITGAWLTDWNRCDRKTEGNTNCDRKDIWNLPRSNRWRPSHLRPTYRTKWPGLHQRLARVLSVCAPSENLETIKPRLYWSMLRCGDSSLRVQSVKCCLLN